MRPRSHALVALLALAIAACRTPGERPEALLRKQEAWRLIEESNRALDRDDLARARALMEQAAATGDPEALNGLATLVNLGIGADPDPERARTLLEAAVAAGSIGAKLNLGMALIDSDAPTDRERAVELLEDLHANPPQDAGRDAVRMYAAGGLATAYLFGRGVEQDVARGVDLLEEADASEEAEVDVVFLLGRAFQSGWGGRAPDAAKSYRYFWRAAQLDHPAAQWNLGMALLEGSGVEANAQEAYRWVRRSGEAGYTEGEISTAVMLALGQGIEEDDAEARRWYERAVRKNSAHALRGLGFMLLTGEGGPRDAAQGFAYLRIAADAGDETAVNELSQFEPRLSDEERLAARRIAAQWRREHGPATPDPE